MIGRTVVNGAKKEIYDVTLKMNSGTTKGLFGAWNSAKLQGDFDIVLNETVDSVYYGFYALDWFSGTILFNCNPIIYNYCFKYTNNNKDDDDIVVVNYTSLCTNIDNIISTRTSSSIVKGTLQV